VNLRTSSSLRFGDPDAERDYELECARARATQRVRYAVAPRQTFATHDGRVLHAGDEVVLERDFINGAAPAWRQLEQLIFACVILDRADAGPTAA
jgi:hypothetical protein